MFTIQSLNQLQKINHAGRRPPIPEQRPLLQCGMCPECRRRPGTPPAPRPLQLVAPQLTRQSACDHCESEILKKNKNNKMFAQIRKFSYYRKVQLDCAPEIEVFYMFCLTDVIQKIERDLSNSM